MTNPSEYARGWRALWDRMCAHCLKRTMDGKCRLRPTDPSMRTYQYEACDFAGCPLTAAKAKEAENGA